MWMYGRFNNFYPLHIRVRFYMTFFFWCWLIGQVAFKKQRAKGYQKFIFFSKSVILFERLLLCVCRGTPKFRIDDELTVRKNYRQCAREKKSFGMEMIDWEVLWKTTWWFLFILDDKLAHALPHHSAILHRIVFQPALMTCLESNQLTLKLHEQTQRIL